MDDRLRQFLRSHKVHGQPIDDVPGGRVVSMCASAFIEAIESAYELGRELTQSELAQYVAADPLLMPAELDPLATEQVH